MPYTDKYITYADYLYRYNGTNGNFFTGYVVGYGYVYPKAGVLFPSHLCGYTSERGDISADETHNIALWQYIEDRSPNAIKQSYKGVIDELSHRIIRENPDNTISVNMGFNEFINIPQMKKTSVHLDVDITDPNNHKLLLSVDLEDDFGNSMHKEKEFSITDLGLVFNSNLPATYKKYEMEVKRPLYPQIMNGAQVVVGGTTEVMNAVQNINSNDFFWRQKNGTFRVVRDIGNNYLLNRSYELSKVRKATSMLGKASKTLGHLGTALTLVDIGFQGTIKPSHGIGLGLFTAGTIATAVGAPVVAGTIAVIGAIYFIVDVGLMLFTDRSLSERIDDYIKDEMRLWEPLFPTENQFELNPLDR